MRFRWLRWQPFLFLEEDGGAGGGGGGNEETSPTTAAPSGSTPEGGGGDTGGEEKMPTYFGQFPKEKMQSDSYKALYRYQKLDELADAFIAQQQELASLKKGTDEYLKVPGKDATEEEKLAFAEKLGVPKEPAGYKLEALADMEKEAPELVAAIRKGCKAYGFTARQGEVLGKMVMNIGKASTTKAAMILKQQLKDREGTLAASYTDIKSDTDRAEQARKDINVFEGFLRDVGLADRLSHTQFAADPDIIKGIAAYARKNGVTNPKGFTGSGSKPKQDTYMGQPYSADFQKLIDSRR